MDFNIFNPNFTECYRPCLYLEHITQAYITVNYLTFFKCVIL